MQDGSLLQRLKPKQGPVVAVKWFTGGPPHSEPSTKVCYLLSAGANGTVVIWCFNMTLALFEWVHMETVFDSAIECVTLDETHSVLAVATLGRIATYQLSKSNHLAMHLLQVHPPLSQSRLPSLPISAHFSDRGHTLMVAFLDSCEIVAWDITPWKQLWHQKIRFSSPSIWSLAYVIYFGVMGGTGTWFLTAGTCACRSGIPGFLDPCKTSGNDLTLPRD
ncbi:hypothetical protein EDD15DRAFT_2249241 [Pisolithus albus]|nr:hypothetical protein EDD15DRAFT_2249241 [Pisolithus albus]